MTVLNIVKISIFFCFNSTGSTERTQTQFSICTLQVDHAKIRTKLNGYSNEMHELEKGNKGNWLPCGHCVTKTSPKAADTIRPPLMTKYHFAVVTEARKKILTFILLHICGVINIHSFVGIDRNAHFSYVGVNVTVLEPEKII